MTHESDSEFLEHIPCEACGSSDANALYTDGHQFCHICENYIPADSDTPPPTREKCMSNGKFLSGEACSLPARKLTEETCKKFGYLVGTDESGEPCQIANYRDDGQLIGQKIRYAGKGFSVRGKTACLFGQHLWSKGKMLVITEGEIDALSVSQVQANKWPTVSIPNGAPSAKKAVARANESGWLDNFEQIILMFDMDEEGRDASEAVAQLFEPGRVKIASLPMHDANDMLVAGRGAEIIDAIWQAKAWRPDGIVRVSDLRERLMRPVQMGVPWPFETLTELTYGRRPGEVYTFGAGTGVGKTDVFTQVIAQTITDLGEKVAAFYLEQPADETVRRVAGKIGHRRFHVPGAFTSDEWEAALNELEANDRLFLYDHFGVTDWDVVKSRIRYLAHAEGVKHFFIDHLTAFAAHAEDERRELEKVMADISGMAQELQVTMYVISHLATPEGKPHEEGGRVMLRHFKGARAIGFWSHFAFGLERDQQAENDIEKSTTTFRVLKDRYTGASTGHTFLLRYDHDTGLLHETPPFDFDAGQSWEDRDGPSF
ncbi:MAG: AAA family ATPase [Actinobacteria bacterium]|nr:AAA family ATPase [Actinomycetota bacterium]